MFSMLSVPPPKKNRGRWAHAHRVDMLVILSHAVRKQLDFWLWRSSLDGSQLEVQLASPKALKSTRTQMSEIQLAACFTCWSYTMRTCSSLDEHHRSAQTGLGLIYWLLNVSSCLSVFLPSMVPHFVFLPRILLPFTWYSRSLPTTAKGIISCSMYRWEHTMFQWVVEGFGGKEKIQTNAGIQTWRLKTELTLILSLINRSSASSSNSFWG